MSLKFFLTVYARLAGVTALVILLCVLLFNGINSVRHQFWHERFADPLMRWLAATPAPTRQYHWMPSLFDLRSGPPEQFDLDKVAIERLGYGQVVAQRTDVGFRYLVRSFEGGLVSLRLEQPYREMAQAVALVVRWHLETVSPEQRADVAAQLAEALGVRVEPVQDLQALPNQDVIEDIANTGLVVFNEQGTRNTQVLLRLEEGDLVVVRMPSPFNPWAWPMIVLLGIVVGSVLAAALFLAMRFVDGHLRKVESVAVRIGRGEMGARVESEDGTLVSRLACSFNIMAEHIQRLVQDPRRFPRIAHPGSPNSLWCADDRIRKQPGSSREATGRYRW